MATPSESQWHVYILDCDGRYYYTGITTDVDRRMREHRSGKTPGARATRGFYRLEPVYAAAIGTRSQALRAEHRLKKLSREEKWRIVQDQPSAAQLMRLLAVDKQGPRGRGSKGSSEKQQRKHRNTSENGQT